MKLIITSLNSKYVHTNLAIRYLKANSIPSGVDAEIAEYTINDQMNAILADLYQKKGNVYAFSCYIWNIEETLRVVNQLKLVMPNSLIVLGGPEVSFDSKDVLMTSSADIVIKGEGETTFYDLIDRLCQKKEYYDLQGISYKKGEKVFENPCPPVIGEIDQLRFPYTDDDIKKHSDKILYYEGSRGCPFKCSYCLSSVDNAVRFHSIKRVETDLKHFIDNNVKQVKFVDRTFNCNPEWAKGVISYIIKNDNGVTNFHFEIAADLLDEEMIEILNTARKGLFQLEIGVQSVNPETLDAINRKTDIDKIKDNVKKLLKGENIHLHLDLIAGLPYEDYKSFANSFNQVYYMNPHMLQLGFLKVLKGSPMDSKRNLYGCISSPYPPYEILSNKYLKYDEIIRLKEIEHIVDKYKNSGKFSNTLNYFIRWKGVKPFEFFQSFSAYWELRDLYSKSHSLDDLYRILLNYAEIHEKSNFIHDVLKLDYLLFNKLSLPEFIKSSTLDKALVFEILKDDEFVSKYMPVFQRESAKKLYKRVHFEWFNIDILHLDDLRKSKTLALFYKVEGHCQLTVIDPNDTERYTVFTNQ